MNKVLIGCSGMALAYYMSSGSKVGKDTEHEDLYKWNSSLCKNTQILCKFLTEEESARIWYLIQHVKKLDTSTRKCDSWYLNRTITDTRNYLREILKHKSFDTSLLEQEMMVSSILDNVLHNNILKSMI